MESLRIVGVQLEQSTDLEYNLKRHIEFIRKESCDLLIFPECSLVGYNLKNLEKYKNQKDKRDNLEFAHKKLIDVIKETKKTVIFGSILYDEQQKEIYNCAFIVSSNQTLVYKKISLTEDENFLFKPGNKLLSFYLKSKSIVPIVCRDQSNLDIFKEIKKINPDLLVILAAHYYYPKDIFWKRYKNIAIPIVRAVDYNINILKVNSAGTLEEKISHGNSIYVDKKGITHVILNEFDEETIKIIL